MGDSFTFTITQVPPNWSNEGLHPMVLYKQRQIWHVLTRTAVMLARRDTANWLFPQAVPGEVRPVQMELHRVRSLDSDARHGTVKPILDAMTCTYRKKVGRKFVRVPGPALIYDDDDRHLPDTALEVRWAPVQKAEQQKVVVTVRLTAREE